MLERFKFVSGRYKTAVCFLEAFWEASWVPIWPPKRVQNEEKSIKTGTPTSHRSWGRFRSDFGAQNAPLEPEKSSSPCSGGRFFHFLAFRIWDAFWTPTWGHFTPTWAPKTEPNRTKMGVERASEIRSILGSIFDAFWGALGGQLGGQNGPKTAPEAPRTEKNGRKNGSQMRFRLGTRLGRQFGSILVVFWVRFGVDLAGFWDRFGELPETISGGILQASWGPSWRLKRPESRGSRSSRRSTRTSFLTNCDERAQKQKQMFKKNTKHHSC